MGVKREEDGEAASEHASSPSTFESGESSPADGQLGAGRMRSILTVGLFTLFSRVTGLLRETTKAHFLGTGMAADAFEVAIRIPNLLRSLVAEGAVSAAIVPVFTEYVRRGEQSEIRDTAQRLITLWLGLVAVTTLLGIAAGGWLVALCFRSGSFAAPEKIQLTTELTRALFGYLFLIGLAACLQGILHSFGRFSLPSLAPFLFNLVFLITVWTIAPFVDAEWRVWVFAGGVLVGGVLQLSLMTVAVWRLGIRPRLRWPFAHEGARRILKLLLPATFGAGIYQINVLVNTAFAGRFESEGTVAALNYSARVMEVVLGVFIFGLNTVSLTALSEQAADGDDESFQQTLEQMLRLALFVTVPSAVGLFVLRREVISLLFLGGQFDAQSLTMTVGALQFHVIGLAFVGLSRGLVSTFYALKDVRTPVLVATICLAANLALAWYLSEGELGFRGIALAGSLSSLLQCALLLTALRMRSIRLPLRRLALFTVRIVIVAALMGLVVEGCRRLIGASDEKLVLGPALLGIIVVGAGLYFTLARLFGLEEGRVLAGGLRRRR